MPQHVVARRQADPPFDQELDSGSAADGERRRYLQNVKFAKNTTSESERQKLLQVKTLFEKYAKRYDVDYLLMAAQGYQESRRARLVRSA